MTMCLYVYVYVYRNSLCAVSILAQAIFCLLPWISLKIQESLLLFPRSRPQSFLGGALEKHPPPARCNRATTDNRALVGSCTSRGVRKNNNVPSFVRVHPPYPLTLLDQGIVALILREGFAYGYDPSPQLRLSRGHGNSPLTRASVVGTPPGRKPVKEETVVRPLPVQFVEYIKITSINYRLGLQRESYHEY